MPQLIESKQNRFMKQHTFMNSATGEKATQQITQLLMSGACSVFYPNRIELLYPLTRGIVQC